MVGDFGYYKTSDLSAIFDVPEHHFIARVRKGELNGQKIGKAYIVSAEEFDRWVRSGNFDYKKRKRTNG